LYQRADVALYAAKDRGRNTTCIFANKLNDEYNLRTQRARFEDALIAGEIEPFFQPKVDLATGQTVGFEMLARWRDPRRGLLTPAYFHRLLTDRQIAPRLTTLMISHAIATHREWKGRSGLSPHFAVNVTHHDLGDPGFVEQTDWLLRGGGLDWSHLELEVTETAILNDTDDQVRKSMIQARQHGGKISLDDFGTGHASLIHLRDWPIDILKLDMGFVREITTNPKDAAIVSSIISLAHRLGLTVVAEGIETHEVANKLQGMGCQIGQGYLFSPAVDAETAYARFFDMTAAQRISA
jgi:EAL domain-containing protein (putative c-di-GMP-specific phosphodiesterase class I)